MCFFFQNNLSICHSILFQLFLLIRFNVRFGLFPVPFSTFRGPIGARLGRRFGRGLFGLWKRPEIQKTRPSDGCFCFSIRLEAIASRVEAIAIGFLKVQFSLFLISLNSFQFFSSAFHIAGLRLLQCSGETSLEGLAGAWYHPLGINMYQPTSI